MSALYHAGSRELQDAFDTRRIADRLEAVTLHTTFSEGGREFIERSPMFFLATADAQGRPDVSYKGGLPGFVRVVEDATLAFGDYDGNGMFRSLGNLLVNPHVALLFVDFAQPDRLRISGTATVSRDDPLLSTWPGAQLLVRVTAEAIFPNCPRYIHRMALVEHSPTCRKSGWRPRSPSGRRWRSSVTRCRSGAHELEVMAVAGVGTVIAAAVQTAPVLLDREATVDKAVGLVAEAAAEGAGLVVFPETFVPGYPDWVWRTKPWSHVATDWYARLLQESVVVGDATTRALGAAAREAGVYLSIGINERDEHGSTLYNTQLWFDPGGKVLGRHRKLMPTGGERLVWGMGDGSTLPVFETPFGRVGGLICWENYMPLARYALYAQGIDVYVAPTWDNSDVWVPTLRHIAKEGRVYVIGVNFCMRGSDVPSDLPGRDELYGGQDDWLARGNTAIIDPRGEVIAGPLIGEEGIVYAELAVDTARAARGQFDPVGHYSRPDVFQLHVDTRPRAPVE